LDRPHRVGPRHPLGRRLRPRDGDGAELQSYRDGSVLGGPSTRAAGRPAAPPRGSKACSCRWGATRATGWP
jgi:hypothetical protein